MYFEVCASGGIAAETLSPYSGHGEAVVGSVHGVLEVLPVGQPHIPLQCLCILSLVHIVEGSVQLETSLVVEGSVHLETCLEGGLRRRDMIVDRCVLEVLLEAAIKRRVLRSHHRVALEVLLLELLWLLVHRPVR